jgi:hypothetical protein
MDDIDATRELALAEAAGVPFCWMRRPSNDVNTPCIYETADGWRVTTTNGRSTEESVNDHPDRAAAVDDFVNRVQGHVRYEELRKKLLGHERRSASCQKARSGSIPPTGTGRAPQRLTRMELSGVALGAIVGNTVEAPWHLLGIRLGENVLFEYGNLETSSRIEHSDDGYVLVDRDRAHESLAAEFSHIADVERYVAIRDAEQRSFGGWFTNRATLPDEVHADEDRDRSVFAFSWTLDGDEHRVRAFGIVQASTARRLTWVRTLSLEQLMEVVTAPSPLEWLAARGVRTDRSGPPSPSGGRQG